MSANNEELLRELKKMTKILTLSNGEKLKEELEKYATSDERKKIWVLVDGSKQPKDIAQQLKMTPQAVNRFLKTLESANLLQREHVKAPTRMIDYVPAEWIEVTNTQDSESVASEISAEKSIPPPKEQTADG